MACAYRFGAAKSQSSPSGASQTISRAGKYQMVSGREEWYERNVPVIHEAVIMLDTETGRSWKLSDIYGAKKWERIDPPKMDE